ncbi:MAG: SRPBCC family protein [Thermoleophilia bacterium]
MVRGSRICYRLRLFGIPLQWRTLIERSNPGRGFVDTQTSGPYRSWTHTHSFAVRNGGVLMEDRVDYELPLGQYSVLHTETYGSKLKNRSGNMSVVPYIAATAEPTPGGLLGRPGPSRAAIGLLGPPFSSRLRLRITRRARTKIRARLFFDLRS